MEVLFHTEACTYKKATQPFALCCQWCEEGDLNPYGKYHTPLKRARLPVPPPSHVQLSQFLIVAMKQQNVNTQSGKMRSFWFAHPFTKPG